ncbi:uncharacterized protein DS421_19g645240 [Arachis hypogaea]|uniref:Uncharacterized protein n=1 Tax=Arachis hypogaea TaxID=3818 RepID=A0A6B9V7B8_ARAHY|nr:uncharacterized protein DS421_19g645240 [Arachis hypogaea]
MFFFFLSRVGSMGFEKEKKGKIDWSYDWVNDDVRKCSLLFVDEEAVKEIDKNKVVRHGSGAKGVWKGGWVNLNSSPGFAVFKLYKSSFKDFKKMFLKVRNAEVESVDRKELISVFDLLQCEENKEAVVEYLGGKYPGVSAATLRAWVKNKNLEKEGSTSKPDKTVGAGEVNQPWAKRKRLSEGFEEERDELPIEEIHAFMDNQKRLHVTADQSDDSSLWGKDFPYMVAADEVGQSSADISLANEVGDINIGSGFEGGVGVKKNMTIAELECKLSDKEKELKLMKENYAREVEDLKKKEVDLSSMSTQMIEVTAKLKEMEKNKQAEIFDLFVEGFERASLQAKFLVPDFDCSPMDPGKIVRD